MLRDNYEQNLALANAAAHAPSLLHVHEDWMRRLERDGRARPRARGPADRPRGHAARLDRGEGLTAPELSVLLAWTKIVLADELLATDLPDDPFLDARPVRPTSRRRCARASASQIERAPAAPRDHRDPGRQRPGQRRRHDLLAPAGRGDRRHARPS